MKSPDEGPLLPVLPQWHGRIPFCPSKSQRQFGVIAEQVANTAIKRIRDRNSWFQGRLYYDAKDGSVRIVADFNDVSAEHAWDFVRGVYGHFHDAVREMTEDIVLPGASYDSYPQKPKNTEHAIQQYLHQLDMELEKIGLFQFLERDKIEARNKGKKEKAYEQVLNRRTYTDAIPYVERKLTEWGNLVITKVEERQSRSRRKTPVSAESAEMVRFSSISCPPGSHIQFHYLSRDSKTFGGKNIDVRSGEMITVEIERHNFFDAEYTIRRGLQPFEGTDIGLPGLTIDICPEGIVTITKKEGAPVELSAFRKGIQNGTHIAMEQKTKTE